MRVLVLLIYILNQSLSSPFDTIPPFRCFILQSFCIVPASVNSTDFWMVLADQTQRLRRNVVNLHRTCSDCGPWAIVCTLVCPLGAHVDQVLPTNTTIPIEPSTKVRVLVGNDKSATVRLGYHAPGTQKVTIGIEILARFDAVSSRV